MTVLGQSKGLLGLLQSIAILEKDMLTTKQYHESKKTLNDMIESTHAVGKLIGDDETVEEAVRQIQAEAFFLVEMLERTRVSDTQGATWRAGRDVPLTEEQVARGVGVWHERLPASVDISDDNLTQLEAEVYGTPRPAESEGGHTD